MPPPVVRVPKHIGRSAFSDVPAYALADAGLGLAVNPAGDGYVYAAFEADGAASAAVAAHVLEADPHSQYELESANTAAAILAKLVTVDGAGSGLDADLLDGNSSAFYLPASSYTAADVLAKLLTVDGAASGLDADLLDGMSSAAFAAAAHAHAGEDITSGTVADARIASTITRDSEVFGIVLAADGSGSGLDADLVRGTTPGTTGLVALAAATQGDLRTAAGLGTIATEAETNYLLASGARVGAVSGLQTLTSGIVTPIIRPASDTTTAIRVQNAGGTVTLLNISTTGTENMAFGEAGATARGFTFFGRGIFTKAAGDGGANLAISGGTNPYATFSNGVVTGKFQVLDGSAIFLMGTQSNHDFQVYTNNSPIGRFTPAGNWFVGGSTAPTAQLHIKASSAARAQLRFDPTAAADPTSPNDGDTWYNSRLKFRRGATTEIIPSAPTQAAFVQTFATAARTMNAYTADDESAAYTGIDNAQVGTVYAQLSDLNALRTAVENLRLTVENRQEVLNAAIDDLQAFAISG